MSIELVALAFDEKLIDRIWNEMPVRDAYDLILDDPFRRKVDPRSLLYHKGHLELLTELECFLRQGGTDWSPNQLLAMRFRAGVEDFPSPSGELLFDYKFVRQFAPLAMVDDFVVAETSLRELLRRSGFLSDGAGWSLLETRDYVAVSKALRELVFRDIQEVREKIEAAGIRAPIERLIRNYIEFLGFAQNNGLTPFFYNSESDLRRWGNLTDRKNSRGEIIVDLSLRRFKPIRSMTKEASAVSGTRDFGSRFRRRLEAEALVHGLTDPDLVIRQKSAESLGMVADSEILPHLQKALSDSEPEVRQELTRAIAATGDPKAEEILLHTVSMDEVLSVRLTAAHLLRKTGSKNLVPLLIDGIEKGNRHYATMLARHPDLKKNRQAQLKLTSWAADRGPELRREVAYILGFLQGKTSRGILRNLCDDSDEETRCNALYSLWRLRDPAVKKASGKLLRDASPACVRAGSVVHHWSKNLRA